MAVFPISGSSTYIQYGWESIYGTASVTINKAFGHGQKISGFDEKNNIERVYGIGNQEAQKLVPKQYEGTFSVDFIGASGYFWRSILGAAPMDAGAGPYTHTYVRSNSTSSFTLEMGYDLDTDKALSLLGSKVNQASISIGINELVKVKLDCEYKDIDVSGTLDGSVASDGEEPLTFAQAVLEIPNGATLVNVQNVEITINRTNEAVRGIGSRTLTTIVPKGFEVGLKCDITVEDFASLWELFWGGSGGPASSITEIADAQLTISNGGATTALRKWEINLTGLQIDTRSNTLDPNEIVKQSVTLFARQVTSVVITDNTAVAL